VTTTTMSSADVGGQSDVYHFAGLQPFARIFTNTDACGWY
jgi:hypothetical protein